jgi:hypothetical protein
LKLRTTENLFQQEPTRCPKGKALHCPTSANPAEKKKEILWKGIKIGIMGMWRTRTCWPLSLELKLST